MYVCVYVHKCNEDQNMSVALIKSCEIVYKSATLTLPMLYNLLTQVTTTSEENKIKRNNIIELSMKQRRHNT